MDPIWGSPTPPATLKKVYKAISELLTVTYLKILSQKKSWCLSFHSQPDETLLLLTRVL